MDWLEFNLYDTAPPDKQRAMRSKALLPTNMKAERPEVYRLWRLCKTQDKLFWDGGIGNQPHILMMEFAICERARDAFDESLNMTMQRLMEK